MKGEMRRKKKEEEAVGGGGRGTYLVKKDSGTPCSTFSIATKPWSGAR